MTALQLAVMTSTMTGTDTSKTGYFLTGVGFLVVAILAVVGIVLLVRSRRAH